MQVQACTVATHLNRTDAEAELAATGNAEAEAGNEEQATGV